MYVRSVTALMGHLYVRVHLICLETDTLRWIFTNDQGVEEPSTPSSLFSMACT